MADVLGRFHQWNGWRRSFALLVLGAFMALGQAPVGWWWATIIGLTAAFVFSTGLRTSRRAFWQFWWVGVGYFAVSLRWIVSPFLVEPEVYGWMAPFALILMAGGAAVFWGLASWLAFRLRGGLIMTALLLVVAEVTRSLILTGFPWALLGHVWIDTPLAQMAAWGGPHLLTLWTVMLSSLLVLSLSSYRYVLVFIAVVGIAMVQFWNTPVLPDATDAPVVRLIQPNAPQDEKWDIDKRHVFFDRMIGFTGQDPQPDLIVWPETAIPQLLEYSGPSLELMNTAARGVPVVTGANRGDGMRYYNTFAVIDGQGFVSDIYDKAHLVPFGEYIPFGDWLGGLGIMGVAPSDGSGFSAGHGQGLVDLPGIGKARALICYEGIFAEEITTDERPRLMVLITNDAWFGPSAGPLQHLAQARLRAIEQGLPMVRVANTGVSAMIDAHGQITGQIGMGQAGFLDLPLPTAAPPTVYVRLGDWPILAFLLLAVIGRATRARRILH